MQLDLENWQTEARQILVALVMDCRGVYDALAVLRPLVLVFEEQNVWSGGACAQRKSCGAWHNDTVVSFCCTAG